MSPISSESPLKEIEKEIIFDSRYKRYTDYINPEGSTSEVVIAIISFLVSIEFSISYYNQPLGSSK